MSIFTQAGEALKHVESELAAIVNAGLASDPNISEEGAVNLAQNNANNLIAHISHNPLFVGLAEMIIDNAIAQAVPAVYAEVKAEIAKAAGAH